jgi:hypothetical protein
MYGKCYESMYEGSMVGAGINVFAVWNYIITKARRGVVEVNPKLLAFTLGGNPDEVLDALAFLQKEDPDSRSKAEGGRRIIKEGEFQYRLVNWEYYDKIKNEDDRREYNRLKQAEYRSRKPGKNHNPMKRINHMAIPDGGAARIARAEDMKARDAEFAIPSEEPAREEE